MEEKKNKKVFNIINIITFVLLGILIFIQVFIWTVTFFKDNSTINIFGYKPYIASYDDNLLDFEQGDLVIGKELDDKDEYIYNSEIIYKQHYRNNRNAVILRSANYNIVEKNSKSRIEGFVDFIIENLGKIILFFREIYIVLIVAFALAITGILIYIKRTNKDEDLDKKYIRNRRIRDISIILFIVTTYISIFLIGKLNKNIGTEAITLDTNAQVDNTVSNSVYNNTITNNITNNNIIQDGVIDTGIVFTVTENGKSWNQIKDLSIFENNYFYRENKIAPGVSGSYEFKVENQSEYNMKYIVNIKEKNDYGVNLKYKIKINGQYLNNTYQSIDEIDFYQQVLKSFGIDVYTIEWKWVDSAIDTQIGENADVVKYNLRINVTGQRQ